MTKQERFEFDLKGYIIYRNVLSKKKVNILLGLINNINGAKGTGKFSFLGEHPDFIELMALRKTIKIAKVLCGEWVRFDHAIGIRMTCGLNQRQGLHGGNRSGQGAFAYNYFNGKIHSGLIKVIYSLTDVNEGDGGFVCIPGSHKSNINYFPESTNSPLVINPTMKSGDMLIFTEALIHGSKSWISKIERFALIYSYSPGFMTWKDPETIRKFDYLAKTDLQKDLMRAPYVGNYDENKLKIDEVWPKNRRNPTSE